MKSKFSFTPAKPLSAAFLVLAIATGCASSKKSDRVELSRLIGKKVALVEIDGEPTARQVVEVALINQLVEHGSFRIVAKKEVERAKTLPQVPPGDWAAVAKAVGADLALRVHVLEFKAEDMEGYSVEEVVDDQLAAERGDGRTERVYKVRALDGSVKMELVFLTPAAPDSAGSAAPASHRGLAEAAERVVSDSRTGAARLPPRLRFLEKLTNQAFQTFFEQYK